MDTESSMRGTALVGPTSRAQKSQPEERPGGLPLSVLTTALWLSLWVAVGSFALAVAEGLGAHPARRLMVGLFLMFGTITALWQRARICASLFTRPSLVLVVGAVQLSVVAVDRLVGGPYVAFTLTSIGLAVIVAPAATVWRLVALLEAGYVTGVLVTQSPQRLVRTGDLTGVLGLMLGYSFAALSLLALAGLFNRFLRNAGPFIDGLRDGAPFLTPALTRAIARPGQPVLALPVGSPAPVRLTAAEIRTVEGIARGDAPKQLAHQWGVSIATVRSHIKHAKRKTGSRTLRELAALVAHPDWPNLSSNDV